MTSATATAQKKSPISGYKTGNPDDYDTPLPRNQPVGYVKAIAAEMSRRACYAPDEKISDMLDRLGGKLVELADMPHPYQHARSCIIVEGRRDFTIYTLELSETQRRRFDIAHELGHYILHYLLPHSKNEADAPKKLRAGREPGGYEESEANWFAMAFLITDAAFLQKYDEFYGNKFLLADYFRVTPSTIVSYGKSLGKFVEEAPE
ncbi:MAG: ImmA/IrrE family metallo-endopeptidase [Alphaproteobacteria bacterium]|nr:ImmA/IrrE family metallo-endopeptidase [Alphaproteobacteria bacterium]